MWALSLCGTKHMIMRHRNEWLAWAATAVGSLGLVGLATAQNAAMYKGYLASADDGGVSSPAPEGTAIDRIQRRGPISDDGWSTEVPVARQVVISRRAVTSPLSIDVFNERGEVVDHIDWSGDDGELKPLTLDALVAGRYAIRVIGAERSQVIRFRRD